MVGGRAVEALEPILVEERGERWLSEGRFPDDPKQRGRRLIRLARQRRQHRSALGRVTVERVRTRPEPELDEPSALRRGQHEMGGFVQDHIRLGSTIQCRSVPVEAARGPLRVKCDANSARKGERCLTVLLCLHSGRAVGRGRADPREYLARQPVSEAGHEAVENPRELLARYRRQNHSGVRRIAVVRIHPYRWDAFSRTPPLPRNVQQGRAPFNRVLSALPFLLRAPVHHDPNRTPE
jgi:hypothetical protein